MPSNLFIPEFSWRDLRIDAIIIDTRDRWISGYEIKVRKSDFLGDKKWVKYSEFCSTLSILCPEGLIDKSEVEKPFGLSYIVKDRFGDFKLQNIQKPQLLQKRHSLSWFYTYTRVLELEMIRTQIEIRAMNVKNVFSMKEAVA